MDGYVRFSRQTLIALASSVSIYLRNLLLIPVLTRYVGKEDYGIWVQVFACSELLLSFTGLGFAFSLTRFYHARKQSGDFPRDMSAILALVAGSSIILGGLGFLASDAIALAFLGRSDAAVYLQVLFLFLPVSTLEHIVLSYYQASRQVEHHSVFLICESFLYVLLAIWWVQIGWGLWGVLWAMLSLRLLTLLVATWLLGRQAGWQLPDFSGMSMYLKYGLPVVPVGLFHWINNASDRFVIAHFIDVEATAVYAISYAIGSMVGFFFSPIFFVLGPKVTQLWETESYGALKEHFLYAQKYPLLVGIPFVAVAVSYSAQIIRVMVTADYAADPALIFLVAFGIISMNLSSLVALVVGLLKKTKGLPFIYLLCSAANLGGNIVAVQTVGIVGAAWVTAGTYLLQLVLMLAYVRGHYRFPLNLAFLFRGLIAVLPMLLILSYCGAGSLLMNIAGIFGGGATYLVCLLALGGFEAREWALVRSTLRM